MSGLSSYAHWHERIYILRIQSGSINSSFLGAVTSSQDPAAIAAILAAAVDVTILMTEDGVICDQVMSGPDLPQNIFIGWPGKSLSDTVTSESRPKIEKLLSEAADGKASRWRQVNHPVLGGPDIPISYTAIRAGSNGHIIAIGRDMSTVAMLQQRLLSAEQAVEQEYQRLRSSETRFRVLLQSASDAIMIVDARTLRVAECNPAVATVLNRPMKRVLGGVIQDLFDSADLGIVKASLDNLRNTGHSEDVILNPCENHQQIVVSLSMFRQENSAYFLIRMVPHSVGTSAVVMPKAQSKVVKIISEMPDGFIVTDKDLKILTANSAFLEFVQLGSEEQVRGMSVDRWLGRPGIDLNMMVSQLNDKGEIRNFQTVVRGQFGSTEEVEVSAVSVTEGDTPCYGFALHSVSRQRSAEGKQVNSLLRSVDEFTKLVGKVPLKELVRESTDIIERLCIEAALQINGDNRAGTAEMLGLSRQSLYVKLNRYGISSPEMSE
jgi:transcriptional regulator PpsR